MRRLRERAFSLAHFIRDDRRLSGVRTRLHRLQHFHRHADRFVGRAVHLVRAFENETERAAAQQFAARYMLRPD